MYVTGDTIIRFATVLGALGTLGALLYPQLSLDGAAEGAAGGNREHQKEQCVICYGLLATLDRGSSSLAQTAMSVMPIRDWKSI